MSKSSHILSFYNNKFPLPCLVRDLVDVRNKLCAHYSHYNRSFTLDGNLIGDLGEVIAADIFGITLSPPNEKGIDGYAPDGKSVQIKASGTKRGPAFTYVPTRPYYLLFFHLDMDTFTAEIIFNGPEEIALKEMISPWIGQKKVSISKIRAANALVPEQSRLQPIIPKFDFAEPIEKAFITND